jgi:hypothetical protein
MSATHEDFARKSTHRGPSDRNFGLVFTAAFLFFGLWPIRHGRALRPWCLAVSAVLLLITIIRPSLLHLPNRLWVQLGLLLGKVVNPIVTGLLFYVVFTPCGLILRLMGKDLLHLHRELEAKTYWIPRTADEDLSNMTNQF